MLHTLFNPNQMKHQGIKVSDDITELTRPFGITVDDATFIPFEAECTTIYFDTHVPSDKEIATCRHIILLSDKTWDPRMVSIWLVHTGTNELKEPYVSAKRILAGVSLCYSLRTMVDKLLGTDNLGVQVGSI